MLENSLEIEKAKLPPENILINTYVAKFCTCLQFFFLKCWFFWEDHTQLKKNPTSSIFDFPEVKLF